MAEIAVSLGNRAILALRNGVFGLTIADCVLTNGVCLNPDGVCLNPNGVCLNPDGVPLNPDGVPLNSGGEFEGAKIIMKKSYCIGVRLGS